MTPENGVTWSNEYNKWRTYYRAGEEVIIDEYFELSDKATADSMLQYAQMKAKAWEITPKTPEGEAKKTETVPGISKYTVRIQRGGIRVSIGTYPTPELAEIARNAALKMYEAMSGGMKGDPREEDIKGGKETLQETAARVLKEMQSK